MGSDYKSQRIRNMFDSEQTTPFKLSRSKIQDFLDCPRCFYLDRRCGTDQPPGPPFRLNTAVDTLLKKEFDKCRSERKPHPLMIQHKIDAIPFSHPDLDIWRDNFKGVLYLHGPTNLIITGAIDDLWIKPSGELIVLDYKATSTNKEIVLDDSEYKVKLKRQLEVYQWLLRRNGFQVSPTGYLIYCNGDDTKESFDGKLDFSISVLPYVGDDSWIEDVLQAIKACLMQDNIPGASERCSYCKYCLAVHGHLENASHLTKQKET
jgi:RecB family exonuclease